MKSVVDALQTGHWPSLLGAWLHFEVSFMVWLLICALGVLIAEDFALTPSQKGLLAAVPLLAGALLRLLVGATSDRFGTKLYAWASIEVALRRRRLGVSRVTEWGSVSR